MSITGTTKKATLGMVALASLGFAAALTVTSPAQASPGPDAPATDVSIQTVGGGVNNCYGEYFTNRWSTSCSNALKAGNYRTKAECDGSTKYGAWVYVSKGSVARGFSEGTCYPAIVRYAEAQYSAP